MLRARRLHVDPELRRRYELVREELAQTIHLNETLGSPSPRAMTELFAKIDAEPERKLDMSLAELELSVRATNCLESEGITTVRHLVSRSEDQLLNVRNFG